MNDDILNIEDFVVAADVCEVCRQGELIPQDEEGILICNNEKYGNYVSYIVDSGKPANKEPPSEVSYIAYIRLNRFSHPHIPPLTHSQIRRDQRNRRYNDLVRILRAGSTGYP